MSKPVALILCLAFLSGCAPKKRTNLNQTYFVVTHGAAGSPFWSVVLRGAMDAGEALDVNVQYLGPDQFSVAEFVSLIDAAIAAQPQGIAVTITDPVAVAEPLGRAAAAGIPVVAINVTDPEGQISYLHYIGSSEYQGGVAAGQKMLEMGLTGIAVCAIHEVGNLSHEQRCQGFLDTLTEQGIEVVKLDITRDAATGIEVFRSHFSARPETGAVLTLGAEGMSSWYAYATDQPTVQAMHGTFDMDPVTLEAIRDGRTRFTIDQQQYLQGFQGVMALFLKHNYEIEQANDVLTGPSFVTADNIDTISSLIEAGYR